MPGPDFSPTLEGFAASVVRLTASFYAANPFAPGFGTSPPPPFPTPCLASPTIRFDKIPARRHHHHHRWPPTNVFSVLHRCTSRSIYCQHDALGRPPPPGFASPFPERTWLVSFGAIALSLLVRFVAPSPPPLLAGYPSVKSLARSGPGLGGSPLSSSHFSPSRSGIHHELRPADEPLSLHRQADVPLHWLPKFESDVLYFIMHGARAVVLAP